MNFHRTRTIFQVKINNKSNISSTSFLFFEQVNLNFLKKNKTVPVKLCAGGWTNFSLIVQITEDRGHAIHKITIIHSI